MKVVFQWLYPMTRRPPAAQAVGVYETATEYELEAALQPIGVYDDPELDEQLTEEIGEHIDSGQISGRHSYCESSSPVGGGADIGELEWMVVAEDAHEGELLSRPKTNPAERMKTDMALVVVPVSHGVVLVLVDTQDDLLLRKCRLTHAIWGYMWLDEPEQIRDGYANPSFRQVMQSAARKGYGPLLYESAMAYVKQEDEDRYVLLGATVSPPAMRLWKRMSYRKDVWRYELKRKHDPDLWDETLSEVPKGLRAMYQHRRRPRWLKSATSRGQLFVRNFARRCGLTQDQARERINAYGNRFFRSVYTGY